MAETMRPFSFIHAADLHIDSPFRGVTSQAPAVAEALHASTFRAFEGLIDTCIEREVDFLLVAGDVYDGHDRGLRAQLRFRDGLARLAAAGIRSYVVHGNHDPLDGHASAIAWPDEVHIFGKKVETVEVYARGNSKTTDAVAGMQPAAGRDTGTLDAGRGELLALLSGVSFPTSEVKHNLARTFNRQEETAVFRIGLLHCNVGADTGHDPYAPCDLQDLRDVGMDYWALGHVHTRQELAADPWIVYPGNTQGRTIREQGARGCYLVQVDSRRHAALEFIPLDVVRWSEGRVSIEEVETLDALERAIVTTVETLAGEAGPRGLVCRITVEGRGLLYRDLRAEHAADELLDRVQEGFAGSEPFVWVQRLEMDCRPAVDLVERATRGDLLAEVLTMAQEYRSGARALDLVFKEALATCWNNSRMRKALDHPDERQLASLLTEAELLCLDLLEDEA